jgi:K(+)-stimulated pyrophosphate-energized sodium pump
LIKIINIVALLIVPLLPAGTSTKAVSAPVASPPAVVAPAAADATPAAPTAPAAAEATAAPAAAK